MITLETSITRNPDFSGFRFYVNEEMGFDVQDFCEAYKIAEHELDWQSVKSAQDAACRLNPGEWLEISFSI